jgi:hypothetical protein
MRPEGPAHARIRAPAGSGDAVADIGYRDFSRNDNPEHGKRAIAAWLHLNGFGAISGAMPMPPGRTGPNPRIPARSLERNAALCNTCRLSCRAYGLRLRADIIRAVDCGCVSLGVRRGVAVVTIAGIALHDPIAR